ncbi:putative receptor-like protein kinase At3g47110 isoform X2 [Ricinus communis]|uniref:putative receptor-like protein kinase At3g47110 isoform X2 n=1 Tax=Ricinus communis TaxID=3988 RepID=UPI00077273DC|nr:putative receptor-like protein kinase At3g47110 isoform X2 [Ricinus communis]|eukprot:XP_015580925.1 putative receptor-like protein kinase At3g47110 isoform X2 [Ricinus communis]
MSSLRVIFAFSVRCFVFSLVVQLRMRTLCTAAAADGNKTDHLSLLDFKAKIRHDPQYSLKSWNDSVHFCNWDGVICSSKHRRVTVLDLQSKGLVGSLSPHVGNLSFLRQLILQNNTLQGEIPQEIGHLFRLQVLRLENNSFEGNYFSGGIPPSLGNLSSLEVFAADGNLLDGTIPESFGKLKYLAYIGLHGNKLSGTFPASIYNLSSIIFLLVSDNLLHGSIPSNIGLQLPHLQELEMWGNHFSGSIPVSLSNASELVYVDLGTNNFTGKVLSAHFGGLRHLSHLALYQNSLGSNKDDDLDFITSLLNSTSFVFLDLSTNQLEGAFPNSVANLSSPLQWLSLGQNRIHGRLPSWLSGLVSLSRLSIQFNQITGSIPSDMGKLQNLYSMFFDHNRLTGIIPSSIGNLSFLNLLHLNDNNLHGTIPSSLGNCHELVFIDLSQNNLNGSISDQLFALPSMLVSIDLSQNQLVGSIPSEVGNLVNMNELIVSKNNLSGNITDDLGRCNSLEFLRLDDNNFQGTIPTSFEALKGLRELDLSKNNLSGEIPEYFVKFALEYLNLSYNDFEGEVSMEGVFANSSVISLEGNDKLCGGIEELKLPTCRVSKKSKSDHVKIIAISISSVFAVALISAFFYCWFQHPKTEVVSDTLVLKSLEEVSYKSILKATNGFSAESLIGAGSFGSVYKVILDEDGPALAIKVLNLQHRGASKSFMAECEALKSIRHRNLVKIITSCTSIDFQGNDFKALVYEYMPNGNLENWLHLGSGIGVAPFETNSLSLLQRIDIAIDIGNALDYLHHQCERPIIHCDLKPSNVLLDIDMVAHIGDFGLAKFLPQLANPAQSSSMGVRGTIGYAPPEYGLGSEVSTSGDVYSYGILLLEMMTGKKPTDDNFTGNHNLHSICRMALPDEVSEIVDPILLQGDETNNNQGSMEPKAADSKVKCLISMIKVGIACSMESPQDRMDISNALTNLHYIKSNYIRTREGL